MIGYGGGVWLKGSTCKFFEVTEMLYFSDLHGGYIAVYIYQTTFYILKICVFHFTI